MNCHICHRPDGSHKLDCPAPFINIRKRIEETFNDLDETQRRRTEAQKPRRKGVAPKVSP